MPAFAALAAILFGLYCQKKEINPVSVGDLNKTLQGVQFTIAQKTITGQVKDASDGSNLSGASVTVVDTTGGLDATLAAGMTDLNGRYEIPGIPVGTFLVLISKIGYIDASLTAYIRDNYWSVELQTAHLRHVSTQALIGAAGGTVDDRDEEGDVIRLSVPAGALDGDLMLSVTHMQGLEVPSYPPAHHLSFRPPISGPRAPCSRNP